MFKLLTHLSKAALGVVTMPVAVAADVVTMGGVLSDQPDTYTGKQAAAVLRNVQRAVDDKEES